MDSSSVAAPRPLWPARVATASMFAGYGIVLGTWTARIPAVKAGLDLGDGALSVALLGFAAGAMTGMQLAGRVVDRVGGARLVAPVAVLDGLLLVAPSLAGSLPALVLALFAFGVAHGSLNIAMNAAAVAVERAWAAPIMTSFHAVYSIGGFVGAAVGGLSAQAGQPAEVTFALVAVAVGGVGVAALRPLRTAVGPAATGGPRLLAPSTSDGGEVGPGRSGGILVLGLLAFGCLVGEGAAADWASVYLRDSLGSPAGLAAAGYAAFAVMMTAGRLLGDRLTAAVGPVNLVRASGLLAAVGLAGALVLAGPVAAVVGFGCFGAGLSCIAPLIFSAAGRADPARAGQAIARVATLGWLGFLVGPVVIGAAAEGVGLGPALGVPAVLAGLVALAAPALHPSRPARS